MAGPVQAPLTSIDVEVEPISLVAPDGTPTTDRNLYLDGATYNGADINGAQHALMGDGAFHCAYETRQALGELVGLRKGSC